MDGDDNFRSRWTMVDPTLTLESLLISIRHDSTFIGLPSLFVCAKFESAFKLFSNKFFPVRITGGLKNEKKSKLPSPVVSCDSS